MVAINTPIPFIADVTDVQHENEASQSLVYGNAFILLRAWMQSKRLQRGQR